MPRRPSSNLPPIALRLRNWRESLGLSQEVFALTLQIGVGTYRKYENGVNVPGGDALVAIGKTGVNLNWLLLGQGEMGTEVASDGPTHRRLAAVRALLDGLEEDKRAAVLDEIFSRVQEAKRVGDLEELVRVMTKKCA